MAGPIADAGLTGRKIIVDTYGGWGGHGGGAFSGKDATKVDRSGAYAARWVAKNLVANKLCERCLVQIAYSIGIPDPLSVYVDAYGTNAKGVSDRKLNLIALRSFDLRPGCIIRDLKLKRPIYRKTAGFGHFGRNDPDFTWEKVIDLSKISALSVKELAENKDFSDKLPHLTPHTKTNGDVVKEVSKEGEEEAKKDD